MSIGEDRVLTQFNPSKNDTVANIKAKAAELIDLLEQVRDDKVKADPSMDRNARRARWVSLAQTAFEEGAMWAVKAATN